MHLKITQKLYSNYDFEEFSAVLIYAPNSIYIVIVLARLKTY